MSNNITYDELDYYAHMASESFMDDPMYKWTTPNEMKRKEKNIFMKCCV